MKISNTALSLAKTDSSAFGQIASKRLLDKIVQVLFLGGSYLSFCLPWVRITYLYHPRTSVLLSTRSSQFFCFFRFFVCIIITFVICSQEAVSCLVAGGFFSLYPVQRYEKHEHFPSLNFKEMFMPSMDGTYGTQQIGKLRCFLNYFDRVTTEGMLEYFVY
jgi:hypothetical protein